ncbi:MAG TPA: dihydrofolate reductase family protein [Solirubrobacteraceae bacterium]
MIFRRLHPDPAEVTPAEQFDPVDLGALAPAGRPYVVVNFVASLDGRAAFRGRSGPLNDEADTEIFHTLRTLADAVLVGTGTLRAERYGRLAARPERREQRVARGLAPDPLAVVITRSGDVPGDIPLLADPASTLVVYTGAELAPPAAAARVEVVRLTHATPTAALAHLRTEVGVRSVLCEGGPTLTAALLAGGLVDELFLTLSPRLTGGGDEPAVTRGPELAELAEAELVWALERESFMFLRYRVG